MSAADPFCLMRLINYFLLRARANSTNAFKKGLYLIINSFHTPRKLSFKLGEEGIDIVSKELI